MWVNKHHRMQTNQKNLITKHKMQAQPHQKHVCNRNTCRRKAQEAYVCHKPSNVLVLNQGVHVHKQPQEHLTISSQPPLHSSPPKRWLWNIQLPRCGVTVTLSNW